MSKTYATVALLGAAYVGRVGRGLMRGAQHTHTIDTATGAPLCRVSADSVADEAATDPTVAPTCPTCLRRDPRFDAPEAAPKAAKAAPKAATRRRTGKAVPPAYRAMLPGFNVVLDD